MQLIYLILNICAAAFIAFISYRNLRIRGGKSIFILALASLLSYSAYLNYVLFPSDLTETIKTAATLFGMTLAATALFTFSLEYTHQSDWIGRFAILLFAISAFYTIKRISLLTLLGTPALLEDVNLLYRYGLIIATIWLLGRTYFLRAGIFNLQCWSMLLGPMIVFIAHGFTLLGLDWNWLDTLSLFSINLSAIGFAYNTFRQNADAGLLVRRGSVVENMEDGWIVLDMQHSIVDINQATAKMAGIPRERIYGKTITSVLNDFPDLVQVVGDNQEIEMDRTVQVKNEYRYLNIRVSTLQNEASAPIGRLVIWRDITNRRRAEYARQHARDEMFVLLNAISNAASRTISLQEFLTEFIYQIIYPFRSQIIFIYTLDERSNREGEEEYCLAAHLGLSTESAQELSKLSASSTFINWIDETKQHLLLEDLQNQHIPEPIRALPTSCLLIINLFIQTEEGKKLIGALSLGRRSDPVYSQDEIVRLTILADHIAKLIDSDRRRKLAIALSERQRLMRDIHDSVSQKLYGLVTITEAAQAKLEAGADLDYGHVLSSIGENARQAVKELRLFLFQMQPIDLEKEGLISVLHHRLAAVEGRADIKVRFLADEPISISKRKETAFYYIAQEALNNVLRHAHAKSVSVTLKQGYKYVTLEVSDDGCGFSQEKLGQGGMGLENIKERVKQENGKLKISSKPDKGTIIKVSFEKDETNNAQM
ncbi:MAG: histidine kinase [Anaerolineae bacterium]|nr:histidine kinase [Anaerolineae bacterium]